MLANTAPVPNNHMKNDDLLEEIQNRVLWLSVYMVDYANNVRSNPGGLKVGGHQASSASVATIMTYLYFEYMLAGDKISVKPHASPVYHAIQYLLGNLDVKYLNTLREFHGLQAYPSRTKDPDNVDFSTGSVGLGAVAPNFASLAHQYLLSHFDGDVPRNPRYISLVGDAELDEGSVWEAISEPLLMDSENVLWVVDLNRQSLDRIIPGIRVNVWKQMFEANGWRVIEAKYGKQLQSAFAEPKGELLRECIDGMSNEVYQRLLRLGPESIREWIPRVSQSPADITALISKWNDSELQSLFRNLGGHDFKALRQAFHQVDSATGPAVIFAYTLKGWELPSVGDPQNHSVALNRDQMEELRLRLKIPKNDLTAGFPKNTGAWKLSLDAKQRLEVKSTDSSLPPELDIPSSFGRGYRGDMSTQQIFGLILTELSRRLPDVSRRVVSVSPDVASSTNLGGWINKVGVWGKGSQETLPEETVDRALKWVESSQGQHIELGISENNLFMCLGQLGLTYEMAGELLLPIGTLYDPFIRRGLDALVYSVYSGARFLLVATPSGITLGPEGGAHQSLITSSIGVEIPDLAFYEPCFGQELEWIVLSALEKMCSREEATYLRLTSKRVDQSFFNPPSDKNELEKLRLQVLNGAYRLIDRTGQPDYGIGHNVVNIIACGAVIPEAIEASNLLLEEEVYANVINVTGPGPLYKRFQQEVREIRKGRTPESFLSDLVTVADGGAPIVTVTDAHPHSLAWIGGALNTKTFPLGVTEYGQSGNPSDLYHEYEIDSESIVSACFGALGI